MGLLFFFGGGRVGGWDKIRPTFPGMKDESVPKRFGRAI